MPVLGNRTREAIYSALFEVLQQITPSSPYPAIVTFSRRMLDPASVPNNSLPAIVLIEGPQKATRAMRGLTKWHLAGAAVYYFEPPSIQDSFSNPPWPVSQVNDALDQIEKVVTTRNPDGTAHIFGQPQTLGGLITDVILGSPSFDQPAFDIPSGAGWAIFPLIMEVGQ